MGCSPHDDGTNDVGIGELGSKYDIIGMFDDPPRTENERRQEVALHLLNDAIRLGRKGRNDEAIAIYDDLINRFGSDPATQSDIGAALRNKGIALGELGRIDEAIAVYDDLISRRFSHRLIVHVALALRNKGVLLERLGRIDEAIAVYDNLINRFSSVAETWISEDASFGLSPTPFAAEAHEHVTKAKSYRGFLHNS
jgi:tetratricopeptide (TPR) repeat protein